MMWYYSRKVDLMDAVQTMNNLIYSMRPKQWIKNGFVFAGLIFSRSFTDPKAVARVFCCFFIFSMISGALYIINDIVDKEKDSVHPVKKNRPIASGRLNTTAALTFSILISSVSLFCAFLLSLKLFFIVLAYSIIVIAYSLRYKNVIIIDVIILSAGFVLRTAGGAVAIDVRISPWLILCTTLLALFLALNKRKSELQIMSERAPEHRKTLAEYSPELINSMLSVITPTTVMCYCLYTFSAGKSGYMMLTIPFVLYGIFRYQYLAVSGNMCGAPETALYHDKPLLVNVALWVIACIIIMALP